jgi:hypothetical protein
MANFDDYVTFGLFDSDPRFLGTGTRLLVSREHADGSD